MSKGFRWGKRFLAGCVLAAFAISLAGAQQTTIEEGKRKVKYRVNPTYPDLARRMSIVGKVRIEVVVAPDGHVKSARAVGGNPVLIQACLDAVKEWKFETAPEETTQLVGFEFKQ